MTRNPLRVAIIGLSHGLSHVAAIERNPHVTLAALVDLDPAVLGHTVTRFGSSVATFANVRDLVRAEVADVAVVAVPTAAHAQVAEACLLGGLHVLLEKPLGRTDEDAARIGRALARSKRVLQIGYEVRSSPLHLCIMDHIARGDLGRITNVWWSQHTNQGKPNYQGWREDRANMGGALFDCAPHFLDLISQWAGAPLHRLAAFGNRLGKTGPCPSDLLPESAVIALEYANGVRGTFNFGAVNAFNDDAGFGVAGTTGCIRGNPIHAGSYELRTHRGVRVAQVTFDPDLTSSGHLGFVEQWDFFLDTILHGAPNVCPFEDALAVHRMMMAVSRSLGHGEVSLEISQRRHPRAKTRAKRR